jgi:UDP-N-acetylglucosamine kinase
MSDAVDRTRYALSEENNERIFREQIIPDELAGTAQQRPMVVFVAGQTGAGKTSVTAVVENALARRGAAVNINLDTYKPRHPDYRRLVEENDATAGAYTSIDGHKWMEKAEAYARAQRFDVVMESAMRDPRDFEEPARRFRADGYQVEVVIVAVHESLSRLGALDRYLQQVHDSGRGRIIDPQIHDACYRGVLRSADAIDAERLADRVFVVRRDGHLVYANQLGSDGHWQQPAATRAAIDSERNRPWTEQETHRYASTMRRLAELVRGIPNRSTQELATLEAATVSTLAGPLINPAVRVESERAWETSAARDQAIHALLLAETSNALPPRAALNRSGHPIARRSSGAKATKAEQDRDL